MIPSVFCREKTTHPKIVGIGSPSQITPTTTRFQCGALNSAVRSDMKSVASNGTIGDRSGPYPVAHIVSTPEQAVDAMRSSDKFPRYENIDNDAGKELSRSVENCNVQSPYPELITHTMPSEVAQDSPGAPKFWLSWLSEDSWCGTGHHQRWQILLPFGR